MLVSINAAIIGKPAQPSGRLLSGPFVPHDLTADELVSEIVAGHAFSARFKDGKRKSENFEAAGFLAIDIDEGVRFDEALALPYVEHFASFLYTTASHTDANHRFRIVFELATAITDPKRYRACLSSLVRNLGGDEACKDAARLFYGNPNAKVHRVGQVLPDDEVEALVMAARRLRDSGDGLATKDRPSVATMAPFGSDYEVVRSDRVRLPLNQITAHNRSIFCPFHLDNRASAFVVWSKTGKPGIRCSSCAKTTWPQDGDVGKPVHDFDWFLGYQRQAERHQWLWAEEEQSEVVGPCLAEDGTSIWLYDDRFLPNIPAPQGLTFIRSPKGSGKTEQLAALVKRLRSDGQRILLIGHRRLLISSLAKRLGLPSYLTREGRAEWEDTGCLAVSIDSLSSFVTDPRRQHFDTVIIDESEQVISHFASSTLARNRIPARALLALLTKRAARVFCADADIGLFTMGFFYLTQDKTHPDHFVINSFRPKLAGEAQGSGTSVVEMYDDDGSLLADLMEDLRAGRRCFVATNSKKTARSLERHLRQLDATKALLLITKDTSDLKHVKGFVKDPASEAANYDAVICSPALSTGVDISFPDGAAGFDRVYGFFYAGITTHFEVDQQLSRVRKADAVRVWIDPSSVPLEVHPEVILDELVENRDAAQQVIGYTLEGDPLYADVEMLDLLSWILSLQRTSLIALKANYLALKEQNGWVVRPVTNKSKAHLPAHGAGDAEMAALIASVPDMSPSEFDFLKHRAKGRSGLDLRQKAMLRRYEIKKFYGVTEVSEALVRLDDDPKFATAFWNLRNLYDSRAILVKEDVADAKYSRLASVDWQQRTRKKDLLETALRAAGIFQPGQGFSFEVAVSKDSLCHFAEVMEQRSEDFKVLFRLIVRSDLRQKPVLQLREVLKLVGMTLTDKVRVRADNIRTDSYRVERERWDLLSRVCGMDARFVARQATFDQLDLGESPST